MTNPTNELYLLSNVDLDPDYNYTLDFDNETAQHAYFENKVANVLLHTDDYSYIRADQSIKVYANIDTLNSVNYLMYKNADKWYYGFVTKKEYVSDKVTRLIFKIDPLQTFMFDYSLEESFIDREHQDRWKLVGGKITPIYSLSTESLEIGKAYKVRRRYRVPTNNDEDGYFIIKSKEPLGKRRISSGWVEDDLDTTQQDTLKSGVYVYIVKASGGISKIKESNYTEFGFTMSSNLFQDPRVIEIVFSKYVPTSLIQLENDTNIVSDRIYNFKSGYICEYDYEENAGTPSAYHVKLGRITQFKGLAQIITLSDYVDEQSYSFSIENAPDIKLESKLYTYPFSYFRLQFGTESFDFYREQFQKAGEKKISIYQSAGLNTRFALCPINYNEFLFPQTDLPPNIFDMQQLTKTHDLTLRTDKWQEYELNNKASMNGGLIAGAVQTVASIGLGVATGGIGLAVAGGQALGFAGQVADNLMKREDIKNSPDNVRPALNDTLMDNSLTSMEIRITEAEIYPYFKNVVYKYFYHYGYKANEFKKPNLRSRYYFNHIKTIGANIKTNIDADYKAEIASIFDKGITIWHYRDATTFKGVNNFEYENAEISIIGGTNGN